MLSLVIPAYNEVDSLSVLLRSIQEIVKKPGYIIEIIFINEGSPDATSVSC